jgi:hypothetical protein
MKKSCRRGACLAQLATKTGHDGGNSIGKFLWQKSRVPMRARPSNRGQRVNLNGKTRHLKKIKRVAGIFSRDLRRE